MYDFYEIPLKFKTADHHSPLYKTYQSDFQSLDEAVKFYISKGFPKEKLILGLNTYGRSYLLFKNTKIKSNNNVIGNDVNRQGSLGGFTKTTGVLAFYEVFKKYSFQNRKLRIFKDFF